MKTTPVILVLILLAFVALIGLGRYAERKRRHKVLGRLFNVTCPSCKTLLRDRNIAIVTKMDFTSMTPAGANALTVAYRVRCNHCGHTMVCEEKQ